MFGFVKKFVIVSLIILTFTLPVLADRSGGRGIPMIPDPDNSGYSKPGDGSGLSAPNAKISGSVAISGVLYSDESPTIVIIGDSLAAQNEAGVNGTHTYYSEVGWFNWANAFLYQRFNILNVVGYSGQETETVFGSLQTDVIDYGPKYCFIMAGINDISNGDDTTDIATAFSSAISTLKASGITPIICTLPPANLVDDADKNTAWHNTNRWLQEHSQSDGFYLYDFGKMYLDASGSYPVPLAGFTDANVHPSPNGAYVIGKDLANFLDDFYPQNIPYGFKTNSDPKSHLTNPMMLGTGGTASTGASGDVADGWTATGTDCAVACAKVARANHPGEWQELTISSATDDSAMARIYQVGAGGTDPGEGGSFIGQQVYAVIEFKIGAGITTPDGIYGSLEARNSSAGVLETISLQYHPSSNDEITSYAEGDTFLLKSPLMTVPADTWTLRVYAFFKVDTGGSGIVYIGQAGIVLP